MSKKVYPDIHDARDRSIAGRLLHAAKFIVPLFVIILVSWLGYHYLQGSRAATPQHVLWGSYVKAGVTLSNPSGPSTVFSNDSTTAFTQQEARIGRKFDVIHRYMNFPGEAPGDLTNQANADIGAGRIPLYNLSYGVKGGNMWTQTANGQQDSYIKQIAAATDKINGTIYINWMHEPTTYPEGTPTDFKNGFIRFHNIMEANKTKHNVRYVVILTAENIGNNPDAYYPGKQYADILGSDGYNWGCTIHNKVDNLNKPGCSNTNWRSFCSVFDQTNAYALSKGTQWWVTETGMGDDPSNPNVKGNWFLDMQQFLESHQSAGGGQGKCPTAAAGAESWSGMTGYIYYQGGMNITGFNIGSSQSSLSAYRALGNDPFFGGGGAPRPGTPSVSFSSPANGANLAPGTIALSATASESGTGSIRSVNFSYKLHSASTWTAIASDTASPYSASWAASALSAGTYDLRAIATDTANQTASDTRTVNLQIQTSQPDLIVADVSAAPGSPLLGQAVTFTAVIKNQGAAIPSGNKFGLAFTIDGKEVTWYAGFSAGLPSGGSAVLVANGGPGGISTWTATAGSHTLQAVVDDQNKVAEANESNNVLSIPITTLQAPTVNLTKPLNNAIFSGTTPVTVPMAATATDDKSVASVSFQSDSTVLITIPTSGASVSPTYNWLTGIALNGQHVITATVRDGDGLNKTSAAATITVTNNQPPQAPKAPTNVHSTAQTSSTIALAWTASADSDTPAAQLVYHIKRNGSVVGVVTGSTSFTDSGLTANTTYSYQIFTTDPQSHTSPDSAALVQATKGLNCNAPTAPSGLTANAGSDGTTASLSWSPVSVTPPCVITHYVVQKGTISIATATATAYSVTGLTPSTQYSFSVLAVTNDNRAGASATTTVTTPAAPDITPPTAPTNVVALPISPTQINLTWTAATDPESNIKQYRILRGSQEIAVTTGTSFGDTGLKASTPYSYTIIAVNGATPSLETSSLAAVATTLADPSSGGGTGTNNDTTTIPSLDNTTSVGTGDDSGKSNHQHAYDGKVSDNPGAALTTPDGNSSASLTQQQRLADSRATYKPALSLPVRLVAGVGGLGLLGGAPLLALLLIRRSGRQMPLAQAANVAPGQIINPTQPPSDEEYK